VQAQLLVKGPPEGPPLVFTAAFRPASTEPPTLLLNTIQLIDRNGSVVDLIKEVVVLNGLEVPFDSFLNGIALGTVTAAGDKVVPDSTPKPSDPIVEVELDLPYPTTDPDKVYWAKASPVVRPFGFQRMRLDGAVKIVKKPVPGLLWEPSKMANAFLQSSPQHVFGNRIVAQDEVKASGWLDGEPSPILCRLRVRSAHVWADDPKTKTRAYLNAEHLGASLGATNRELLVDQRDPQRAGDLDMFFYLRLG
jgi:hypothetical protein